MDILKSVVVPTLLSLCVSTALADDFDDLLATADASGSVLKDSKPEVFTSIKMAGIYKDINDDSRRNPNNEVANMLDTAQNLEVELEMSHKLGKSKDFRWFIKTHNFIDSDIDKEEYARIDEAFVDYSLDKWYVMLGKKRINWGHAFAFNPVNVVVPPKDLLNPNQETEGHPMLWMQKGFNKWSINTIVTKNYDKDWQADSNQWGVRVNKIFDAFDVSLYYFDGQEYTSGDPYPTLIGSSFSVDFGDGALMYGEFANFGYNDRNYYDAAGNVYRKDGKYNDWVLGFNNRFGLENTFLLEFFHGGSGYSESERKNYLNTVDNNISSPNISSLLEDFLFTEMAKNYLLVGYEKTWKDNYNYIFRSLISEDKSILFGMIGTYTFKDSYALELLWRHTQGGRNSELGNDAIDDELKLSLIITY